MRLSLHSPQLKKTGLETSNTANFRPESNRSFMSKVVEKVFSRQLNKHLTDQGLLPRHQSAYRKYHSTETAMLQVMLDALTADNQWHVTLIGSCWICRRPSTASTIPCCCNDYNARAACPGRLCAGWRHMSLVEVSKWSTVVSCHPYSQYSSEYRRGLFQVVCSSSCTQLPSVEWWWITRLARPAAVRWRLSTLHQHASGRCCSAGRPTVPLSTMTLKTGWVQADCDWTQPRHKSCGRAPSTNCSSSTFKAFQSCQHPPGLSTQRVILEWWSTEA